MPQWTPGPWLVMDNWYIVTDKDRTMVATTSGGYPKQTEANARLIALAPEMVAALQRIRDHETRADRRHRGMVDMEEVETLRRIARTLLVRLDA